MGKISRLQILEASLSALKSLAVRFPVEFKTTLDPLHCDCIQFEDNDECRHIRALEVLEIEELGK